MDGTGDPYLPMNRHWSVGLIDGGTIDGVRTKPALTHVSLELALALTCWLASMLFAAFTAASASIIVDCHMDKLKRHQLNVLDLQRASILRQRLHRTLPKFHAEELLHMHSVIGPWWPLVPNGVGDVHDVTDLGGDLRRPTVLVEGDRRAAVLVELDPSAGAKALRRAGPRVAAAVIKVRV